MFHPTLAAARARQRYDQLLQEAETYRQIAKLRVTGTGLWDRVLSRLGGVLIAAGRKLKMQESPGVSASIEPRRLIQIG